MKKLFFFVFIFFVSGNLFSQEKNLTFQILDNETKEPVSYATIIIKNTNRATHADFDGFFKIPQRFFETGFIGISSIGYQTKEVKLSDYKKESNNKIVLNIYTANLDEIVITAGKNKKSKKKLKTKDIVKNAIHNILENYPTNPHSFIGYYRDYQQPTSKSYKSIRGYKENPNYVNLNEGIIEVFDQGFQTSKFIDTKNQSLIYKYNTNTNFIVDSLLKIPYDNSKNKFSKNLTITPFGGNELNILNITNAIRNHNRHSFSFADTFNKDFVSNHKFKMEGSKNMKGVSLYEISFKSISHKTSSKYKALGTIYISKYNFEIYKLNYNLYYLNSKQPQYNVILEYLPRGDKMYLNYMMFNNLFSVKDEDYFRITGANLNVKKGDFNIFFNKPIHEPSIDPSNFNLKIYYKKKRLKVLKIDLEKRFKKTLVLKLDLKQMKSLGISIGKLDKSNFIEDLDIKVKNLKSLSGHVVNVPDVFNVYQFREFFVQEVFENKNLPESTNFINKFLPLSKAVITPLELKNTYWLNTPLKSSK